MIHLLTSFLKQSRLGGAECQSQPHTSPKLYKPRCLYDEVYFGEWNDSESELSSGEIT